MDLIDYEPSADPLCRNVPLRYRTTIPVLGFPVHFASNAPSVIDLAEEAFGGWRVLEGFPELLEEKDVSVSIVVHPGSEGESTHADFVYRFLGEFRLLIGSPGSVAFSDPVAREAVGYVTPGLVSDRQHFRYGMLEALTLGVVTRHDRQPFHAAALVQGGVGVVLAGPSGAGKSTLAYAAARAGIGVLTDDSVYVQSRPEIRIWGLPGYVHLPLETRDRFPELSHAEPTVMANGKRKLAIDLRALHVLPEVPVVQRLALCLLGRGERTRLTSLGPEAAADELLGKADLGFDDFVATLREPLVRLGTEGAAWRLDLSEDPEEALPWIELVLDQLQTPS